MCVLIDRSLFIHYYYYTIITLTHILFAIIIFLLHTIMSAHSTTTTILTYYNIIKKSQRGRTNQHFYPTFFPIILNVKGWMVTQMFQLCSVHSAVVAWPQWWNLEEKIQVGVGRGISGSFFLSFSRSQVVIKKLSNDTFFGSKKVFE